MHTDPDYSAAYVVLRTDAGDGVEGHGLTFTSGRGTEVCVAAIRALEPLVVGRTLEAITGDMRGVLAQPRLGHAAALARAREGRDPSRDGRASSTPSGISGRSARASRSGSCSRDLSPERARRAASTSATSRTPSSPDEALEILRADARPEPRARARDRRARGTRPTRPRRAGSATRTTRSQALVREALAAGFTHVKMKVGGDLDADDPPRRADPRRRSARTAC